MIEGPGILKSASCGEFSELLSSYPDSCVRPMQRVRSWPAYTLELITKCKETGGAPGLVWTGAENLSHTGFEPRTAQSTATGYIDCAIPTVRDNTCTKHYGLPAFFTEFLHKRKGFYDELSDEITRGQICDTCREEVHKWFCCEASKWHSKDLVVQEKILLKWMLTL